MPVFVRLLQISIVILSWSLVGTVGGLLGAAIGPGIAMLFLAWVVCGIGACVDSLRVMSRDHTTTVLKTTAIVAVVSITLLLVRYGREFSIGSGGFFVFAILVLALAGSVLSKWLLKKALIAKLR